MEEISEFARQLALILREIYSTPLAATILFALMWRAYAEELNIFLIPGAFLVATIVTFTSFDSRPAFLLDPQRRIYEFMLNSFPWIQSFGLESKFLSPERQYSPSRSSELSFCR